MKILEIEEILEQINRYITVNPDFLKKEQIEVPILRQMDILLDAAGEKGLKLTAKGNLPTKVVKSLVLCCPTPSDARYLAYVKRYNEDDHVPAMRVKNLSLASGLLVERKGKLVPSAKVEAYRTAKDGERFLFLFGSYGMLNLGYFDGMQEAPLVKAVSFSLLQVIRDKPEMFREVEVYTAFLIDAIPEIFDDIEEEIFPDLYLGNEPLDEFEHMVKVRLMQNFFAVFGLIEEQGTGYKETYECQKTALLDAFIEAYDVVDTSIVLNKKHFKAFEKRAKDENLNVSLFTDFCHIYTHVSRYPATPIPVIADDLAASKRVIGTAAESHKAFFSDLAKATVQTLKQFTQLEVIGGGERGESLQDDFRSFIDGLYAVLPNDKPFKMIEELQATVFSLFDMLEEGYDVDVRSPRFYEICIETFDEEIATDIGSVIVAMGELQKKSKKFKRINTAMQEMAKELIMLYVLAVMSIHTDDL